MVVLWAFIVKFQYCSEVSVVVLWAFIVKFQSSEVVVVVGFYCEVSVCTVVRSVWLCCGLLL